jgi:hypothetical protein
MDDGIMSLCGSLGGRILGPEKAKIKDAACEAGRRGEPDGQLPSGAAARIAAGMG